MEILWNNHQYMHEIRRLVEKITNIIANREKYQPTKEHLSELMSRIELQETVMTALTLCDDYLVSSSLFFSLSILLVYVLCRKSIHSYWSNHRYLRSNHVLSLPYFLSLLLVHWNIIFNRSNRLYFGKHGFFQLLFLVFFPSLTLFILVPMDNYLCFS